MIMALDFSTPKISYRDTELGQGWASVFCEGPDSKCLRLCRSHGPCRKCSAMQFYKDSSLREYANEGAWLCFNKTFFTKLGGGWF